MKEDWTWFQAAKEHPTDSLVCMFSDNSAYSKLWNKIYLYQPALLNCTPLLYFYTDLKIRWLYHYNAIRIVKPNLSLLCIQTNIYYILPSSVALINLVNASNKICRYSFVIFQVLPPIIHYRKDQTIFDFQKLSSANI